MNHDGNALRLKLKIRNQNATTTVADDNDKVNDRGNNKFHSIGHNLRIDSETTMEEKLLSQPSIPVSTANPRSSSASSSSSPTVSNFVDCSLSLSSWSCTGRRGRKSTCSTTTTTTTSVTTILSNDLSNTESTKIETHSNDEKLLNKKIHSKAEIETKNDEIVMEVMKKIETHSDNYEKSPKRKVYSKVKIKTKKDEIGMGKEHICNVCNKVFLSPKALGGHKSSHYKGNKTDIGITKKTTITIETQISTSTSIGTKHEPNTTLSLGSSADQSSRKRKMIDFDLNQLPPSMDDDDQQDNRGSCSFLHL